MDATDLFPDGGFVRLRSRARDKYIHADGEDETSVSLRPLGDVPSINTVWKVQLWPVEGEGNLLLLLQGAAYGRYLAVAPADDFPPPPSGHRGVRAVQRDYNPVDLDPSFMWTPCRVEAGQNYVRLHNNEQLCLRANGRPHRLRANGRRGYSNNLVTVEPLNRDETTMMQWTVEATPEPLPLPPPPHPPMGYCCGCERKCSTPLCCLCAARMKTELRGARKMLNECAQKLIYCLECKRILPATHEEHRKKTIPLGRYKNRPVAWVTGDEKWSIIFESIESPDRAIKPYQLYRSEDPRCNVCGDIVSGDGLYGNLIEFCSLQCFVGEEGNEDMAVEKAFVAMNGSDNPVGFCLSCAMPVLSSGGGNTHADHDWVPVHTNSLGLWVIIPHQHPKEQTWASVKKLKGTSKVLVRDDSSVRCQNCHKRLASADDSCSLQCTLDGRPGFLPRPLMA